MRIKQVHVDLKAFFLIALYFRNLFILFFFRINFEGEI